MSTEVEAISRRRETYGFIDVVNQLLGLINLLLRIGHDQTVKIFLLVTGVSSVRTTFSFLDRSLSTDGNFSSGFCFHLLQGISTRTDK